MLYFIFIHTYIHTYIYIHIYIYTYIYDIAGGKRKLGVKRKIPQISKNSSHTVRGIELILFHMCIDR